MTIRDVTKKTGTLSIGSGSRSGSSSDGNSDLHSSITPDEEKLSKEVSFGRGLFSACLAILVAIMATGIYFQNKNRYESEIDSANSQYDIIMNRALILTERLMQNRLEGAKAMAKLAAYAEPRAELWPFVRVDSWWAVGESVQVAGLNGGYSLAPIVTPENQPAFEDFAQEFLNETYPGEDAGVSSFGFGIWCKNATTESEDNRYHHTNGYPYSYESENAFATPKFQHTKGNHRLLMMDVHGFPQQGKSIDDAYTCSKNRATYSSETESSTADSNEHCQALSDLTPPKDPKARTGPGAFVSTCVFPAENSTECVAMIFAKMNIYEVLDDTFPDSVRGITCVVDTKFSTAWYKMEAGQANYLSDEGDLETASEQLLNANKENQTRSMQLFQGSDLTGGSISYDMSCFPTNVFYDDYMTEKSLTTIIVGVVILVGLCVCFFLYDFWVRREFRAKKDLLKAKRQFVRFVSHEVRTPLNSVCMALTLLQEEIAQSLGYDTTEEMQKIHMQLEENSDTIGAASGNNADSGRNNRALEIGWFKLAKEVQVNAESSVEVLNDLLNYDKVESGSLSLELTAIPIWDTIKQTVSEFRLPADSKDIKLSLKLPPKTTQLNGTDSPTLRDRKVVGDSIRLVQVVRNLVSNAIKFTPAGKSVNVNVHWRPAEATKEADQKEYTRTFKLKTNEIVTVPPCGEIVLCVEDEGAGLSAEQQSKLFGVGVQFNVNELQAGNGSGLGLFIAKGIIEQHEGALVCHSAGLGCGTSFTVTLPLYNIPDPILEHPEVDEDYQITYQQKALRVLIVDDARSNRKLLMRLLTKRDNVCDEAENGEEAVEMVKAAAKRGEAPYDVILLDYEMPVMNGPTAAREIQAVFSSGAFNQHHPSFIVGVTGNFMDEDIKYFKQCGANAVLPKPFKVQELENLCVEYHVTGSVISSDE
mmetsp:Transcript_10480/g.30652  ORF Transcript_10480/g.30652 Transcript_10480/m.30652 type:complete len:929 (+) Transcript_10480:192-2978(+)